MKMAGTIFQVLCALVMPVVFIFLTLNYNTQVRTTTPLLWASGSSLLSMIALLIKTKSKGQSRLGYYFSFSVMLVAVATSFTISLSYSVGNPILLLAMSGVTFLLSIVTVVTDFRTLRVTESSEFFGVKIAAVVLTVIAILALAFTVFMYFLWMGG